MTDDVPFSRFMEDALYDSVAGFYTRHGRAGRRGDFLTSPEVGPLFGALVAERLDREWDRSGRPSRFTVVDAGAGPGTLARAVAFAGPRCADALRYVMVEISDVQRSRHAEHLEGWRGDLGVDVAAVDAYVASEGPGPGFVSASVLPSRIDGLVLANELLDNLPFDIVRATGSGTELLLVVEDGDTRSFVPSPVTLPDEFLPIVGSVPVGTWIPWQHRAREWVRDVIGRIGTGTLVVLDYGGPTAQIAAVGDTGWLRTYAGHERGGDPLADPGEHDITSDIAVDQLSLDVAPTMMTTQREWLLGLGVERLVEEGRRMWHERASAPDVAALRARSRVGEAEALLDLDGLGRFVVLEWTR